MLAKRLMTPVIIVGLALVTGRAEGQTQGRAVASSDPIAIGIMRVDGLLIPMVTLQDGTSSNLSVGDPDENRSAMAPEARELEGRPWTLWKRAGGAPTEFRITGRAIADAGYFRHEAWTTTFKGIRLRPGYVPIAKAGLATQGIIVEQPENVASRPDAASQRVGRLISHLAHAKETEMVTSDPHHPLREQGAAARASTVVRLTKLWRRRAGNTDTYYFEAVKQYGHLPVLATGWVVVAGGKARSLDVTSLPSDDVYKQGVYRTVLGIVPFRGRDLWVMEAHYYEGEDREVRVWPSGKCGWDDDREC
jgi:hypothetical protein